VSAPVPAILASGGTIASPRSSAIAPPGPPAGAPAPTVARASAPAPGGAAVQAGAPVVRGNVRVQPYPEPMHLEQHVGLWGRLRRVLFGVTEPEARA
jgi:hypothetical protein